MVDEHATVLLGNKTRPDPTAVTLVVGKGIPSPEILHDANLRVTCVHSGLDALDSAGLNRPDVLVVPFMLSDMTGLSLCGRLGVSITGTPAVLMLGPGEHEMAWQFDAFDAGVDVCLREDVNPRLLVRQIVALGRRVASTTAGPREDQVLREAARRKDEFIAILSHELRSPLAPIRYALPVLNREPLTDAGQRAVQVIARQTAHLARLVDDLLDVSRITRGKVELRKERVALGSIVAAAVEAASPAITAARHTLEVVVRDRPIWLLADAARIAQVVTNLLDNSAKYTPSGGRLRLEATTENGEAVVRVRDNGIGIPADALPTVFDMFNQVQRPDRPQCGLGIGLALVKRLVEMHHGTIRVFSKGLGQGAEFVVRLPLEA